MSTEHTGANPAFPGNEGDTGISLMGYFSGQALVGILASGEFRPISVGRNQERAAKAAKEMAQKMMEQFPEG